MTGFLKRIKGVPKPIIALALILSASIIITGPVRDFPLDDSWIYFLSVEQLLSHGALYLPGVATLVLHTLWGAVFGFLFGLSFSTLRFSTLILAVSSIFLFYALLRKNKISEQTASAGSLLLWANPIYFLLSFTFMTDVPFLFWMLLSLYAYSRSDQTAPDWLWFASAAAAAAFLVRQNGALIIVGMLIHQYLNRTLSLRQAWRILAVPALVVIAYLIVYFKIVGPSPGFSAYVLQDGKITSAYSIGVVAVAAGRTHVALLYFGLFLAPLALSGAIKRGLDRADKIRLGAWAVLLTLFTARFGLLPLKSADATQGIINRFGLGTLTLSDPSAKGAFLFDSSLFWLILTGVSFLSILAALRFCSYGSVRRLTLENWFFPSFLPFVVTLTWPRFYDRYLIAGLPFFILLLLRLIKTVNSKKVLTGSLLLLTLSASATHDYLAWNQAAWTAALMGVHAGISPKYVHNGVEWTGLLHHNQSTQELKKTKALSEIGQWDWLHRLRFRAITSFSAKPATTKLSLHSSAPYRSALTRFRESAVHLHMAREGRTFYVSP